MRVGISKRLVGNPASDNVLSVNSGQPTREERMGQFYRGSGSEHRDSRGRPAAACTGAGRRAPVLARAVRQRSGFRRWQRDRVLPMVRPSSNRVRPAAAGRWAEHASAAPAMSGSLGSLSAGGSRRGRVVESIHVFEDRASDKGRYVYPNHPTRNENMSQFYFE